GHTRVRDALTDGDLDSAVELFQSRLEDLAKRQLSFIDVQEAATAYDQLDSPIKRVFYTSSDAILGAGEDGMEVFPRPNPRVNEQLEKVHGIVYGMGSLYTSIVPSLTLVGVGTRIASRDCPKVMLLNGAHDRETSGMSAADIVVSVTEHLNLSHCPQEQMRFSHSASEYCTAVLYPRGTDIEVDEAELHKLGIEHVVAVQSNNARNGRGVEYDVEALIQTLLGVMRDQAGCDTLQAADVNPIC
ncbi:hypothetical protein CYMTET_49267, partial [Cymbomonas tetramitiformis]